MVPAPVLMDTTGAEATDLYRLITGLDLSEFGVN